MTTLSWLFYLAHISEGLNKFFGVFFTLFLLGFVIRAALVGVNPDNELKDWGVWRWWKTATLVVLGIPLLLTSLVPDYNTILTIAAVEMGDSVLHSEEFERLLDTYIPKEED